MKKLLHFLLSAMLFTSCQTAKKTVFNQMVNTENTYLYAIDLVNVEKDKVSVTLLTPKSNLEKGRFVIPKLVPGYYAAMDFGQYISDFKAVDKAGNPLKTEHLDKNSWWIYDLKNLHSISYLVDDGWDGAYPRQSTAKSPSSMFLKDAVLD